VAFDPDGGDGATKELAASWGSFQIWVRGINVCSHLEKDEVIQSVHWYLLPLLEWLATHWDALFHEEHLPIRNAGDDAWTALERTGIASTLLSIEQIQDQESRWYEWRQRHAIQVAPVRSVPRALAIFSLVASCQLHGLDVESESRCHPAAHPAVQGGTPDSTSPPLCAAYFCATVRSKSASAPTSRARGNRRSRSCASSSGSSPKTDRAHAAIGRGTNTPRLVSNSLRHEILSRICVRGASRALRNLRRGLGNLRREPNSLGGGLRANSGTWGPLVLRRNSRDGPHGKVPEHAPKVPEHAPKVPEHAPKVPEGAVHFGRARSSLVERKRDAEHGDRRMTAVFFWMA